MSDSSNIPPPAKLDPESWTARLDWAFSTSEARYGAMLAAFEKIMALPLESPEAAARLSDVRQAFVRLSKSVDAIHHDEKRPLLQGGRMVDRRRNRLHDLIAGVVNRIGNRQREYLKLAGEMVIQGDFGSTTKLRTTFVWDEENSDLKDAIAAAAFGHIPIEFLQFNGPAIREAIRKGRHETEHGIAVTEKDDAR